MTADKEHQKDRPIIVYRMNTTVPVFPKDQELVSDAEYQSIVDTTSQDLASPDRSG